MGFLNSNKLMKVLDYLQVNCLQWFLRTDVSSDFISIGRK